MDEKKKKELQRNASDRNIIVYNEKADNYRRTASSRQVQLMRLPLVFFRHRSEQKKVTDIVRTFLKEDSNGFQISTAKVEPEKVTDMVGTFLKQDGNGFQTSITKVELEKVTDMVGTFLNNDGVTIEFLGLQDIILYQLN